jgi:hypothetical protein
VPSPAKSFTLVIAVREGNELVERDGGGFPAAWLESDVPRAIDLRKLGVGGLRQRLLTVLRSLAEDDEHRAPRLKVQRHRRPPIGNLERGRSRSSGLRIPQLRGLVRYAEARFHRRFLVAAIVEEVKIAVGDLAMHEVDLLIAIQPR